MKHSIALKIFALAVGILTLAVCVTIYTNIEVIGLGKDINVVARTTLPLAKEAAEIDECALERRIAFQTLYGEYMEPNPNQALIEKETKKLEHERQCFHENLEDLRKKLAVLPDDRVQRELYARARELATEMESDFLTETEMAKTILEHRRKGNRDKAHELKVFDDALEDKIDENGKRLQEILMKLAEVSAIRAKQRETRVLWSSITTTLFSIFGGLAVAWFISRNLAQPIGELLKRTRAVESGDLSQKSGDLPEDEIGQLGESFNSMVAELKRKEDLQKAFSTYIDPRIVEKVILPGRPDDMAGQKTGDDRSFHGSRGIHDPRGKSHGKRTRQGHQPLLHPDVPVRPNRKGNHRQVHRRRSHGLLGTAVCRGGGTGGRGLPFGAETVGRAGPFPQGTSRSDGDAEKSS